MAKGASDAQEMEYKTAPTEFKATGDKGEYDGHFSIFGNVDDGLDVMEPGAFTRTISERANRVRVFFGHAWDKLIGPPPTTLKEDEVGLFAAGRLTIDSFWGREAWVLMKDGALVEGSIGYRAVKYDFDDNGIRHLREVKLYEISPVPLGMNPLTSVRAMKAAILGADPDRKADQPADAYLETLSTILEEIKEERALVTATPEQVTKVCDALKQALEFLHEKTAAEPEDPEPQDRNHSALLLDRRLRAAELALAI